MKKTNKQTVDDTLAKVEGHCVEDLEKNEVHREKGRTCRGYREEGGIC